MKDADKLKLMLLAWNYQNSAATRNGTEGPDLNVMSGLWTQYQNALAMNATAVANSTKPSESSISPIPRNELASPMENQDETNSSGQKDEDEGSEDDSDDKLDQAAHDPERLKAFNVSNNVIYQTFDFLNSFTIQIVAAGLQILYSSKFLVPIIFQLLSKPNLKKK